MSNKPLPRCVCITKDGTQRGRRVSDGSNPPVCHVHRAQQAGTSVSPLTEPLAFSPEETLRRIAADSKHAHQVQALRMLLDRQGCSTCAARAATEDPDGRIDVWGDVTDHEGERLRALIAELQPRLLEFKQIRAAVVARIKQGTTK